ncbi:unnamed protein product [Diplocarpon coronariae]
MRLSGLARAQACFPEHPGRRGLFSIFPHACSPRPGAAKLQAGEPPRQSSREVIASHLERSRDRVCPDLQMSTRDCGGQVRLESRRL